MSKRDFRQAIYKVLAQRPYGWMTAAEVAEGAGISGSSARHHLCAMAREGAVLREDVRPYVYRLRGVFAS